jgi:hypothetical protein
MLHRERTRSTLTTQSLIASFGRHNPPSNLIQSAPKYFSNIIHLVLMLLPTKHIMTRMPSIHCKISIIISFTSISDIPLFFFFCSVTRWNHFVLICCPSPIDSLSSKRNHHPSSGAHHCSPSPSKPFHSSPSRFNNYSSTAHAQRKNTWSCDPNNPDNPTNSFSKAPRLQTFISLSLPLPDEIPLPLENNNDHHDKISFLTYATLNNGIHLPTSTSSLSSSPSSLSIDQDTMMNHTLHIETSDIDILPSLSHFKSELSSVPPSIDTRCVCDGESSVGLHALPGSAKELNSNMANKSNPKGGPQSISLGMKSCQINAHQHEIHNTYEGLSPHLHVPLYKVQSRSSASRLYPSPALGLECHPSSSLSLPCSSSSPSPYTLRNGDRSVPVSSPSTVLYGPLHSPVVHPREYWDEPSYMLPSTPYYFFPSPM